jgi:hypothetical protein
LARAVAPSAKLSPIAAARNRFMSAAPQPRVHVLFRFGAGAARKLSPIGTPIPHGTSCPGSRARANSRAIRLKARRIAHL